jgi:hypothetical protein
MKAALQGRTKTAKLLLFAGKHKQKPLITVQGWTTYDKIDKKIKNYTRDRFRKFCFNQLSLK